MASLRRFRNAKIVRKGDYANEEFAGFKQADLTELEENANSTLLVRWYFFRLYGFTPKKFEDILRSAYFIEDAIFQREEIRKQDSLSLECDR